ncbi:MAG: helix-turn-helix domain-containing protein [Terracidiphilus sp.]
MGQEEQLRRELDEVALGFRLAHATPDRPEGWLKPVRQAIGISTEEVGRRMGVSKWAIYGLEKSEKEARIMLGTLRRAAEAMDCDLVYALVPREGTLAEMAARRRAAAEVERERARQRQKEQWKSPTWRAAAGKALLETFRRAGLKVG